MDQALCVLSIGTDIYPQWIRKKVWHLAWALWGRALPLSSVKGSYTWDTVHTNTKNSSHPILKLRPRLAIPGNWSSSQLLKIWMGSSSTSPQFSSPLPAGSAYFLSCSTAAPALPAFLMVGSQLYSVGGSLSQGSSCWHLQHGKNGCKVCSLHASTEVIPNQGRGMSERKGATAKRWWAEGIRGLWGFKWIS